MKPRSRRPVSRRVRFLLNSAASAAVSCRVAVLGEELDGRALERTAAAAVEERAGARHRLDDRARPHGPGHAPARVAPVLGQAVEQHHRIAVHVLHVARRADQAAVGDEVGPPHVVRVELVDQHRAVQLARDGDPLGQVVAADQLAGRVARVREQQRRQPAPHDLAAQLRRRERVAAVRLEQDRDRREQAEDVEQLLVRGVVGQEVAQVDLAQRRRRAGQRRAPAAGHRDVLRAVLRRHAAPVQPVVEVGDRLAQLPQPGHRRVLLVLGGDVDVVEARRCAPRAPRPPACPGRGCTSLGRPDRSRGASPRR